MNPMLRLDAAIARYVTFRFAKDRSKVNLMPWPAQEERIATKDDFMNILKTSAASRRKH
jgi:hypothetical protein